MKFTFGVIVGSLLLAACANRPVEELILADVAVRSAQKAKADALASDVFRKAENYFLRAKKDFTEGYFEACRKHANDARLLAEQAEYKALSKQNQVKSRSSSDSSGRGQAAEPVYPSSEGFDR